MKPGQLGPGLPPTPSPKGPAFTAGVGVSCLPEEGVTDTILKATADLAQVPSGAVGKEKQPWQKMAIQRNSATSGPALPRPV